MSVLTLINYSGAEVVMGANDAGRQESNQTIIETINGMGSLILGQLFSSLLPPPSIALSAPSFILIQREGIEQSSGEALTSSSASSPNNTSTLPLSAPLPPPSIALSAPSFILIQREGIEQSSGEAPTSSGASSPNNTSTLPLSAPLPPPSIALSDPTSVLIQREEIEQFSSPNNTLAFPLSTPLTPSSILIKQQEMFDQAQQSRFNISKEISRINQESLGGNRSFLDKERELSRVFKNLMIGSDPFDGFCLAHSFNTHLLILNNRIEEIKNPWIYDFNSFGSGFWEKTNVLEENDQSHQVFEMENETFGNLRRRVAEKVQSMTVRGESVLITLSQAHWYNAYNDGDEVWFIDSQTGQGFNLYTEENYLPESIPSSTRQPERLSIYRVTQEDIHNFMAQFAMVSR